MINAGADGIRVGMGPGAICTTRIISGMGVPQITAIMETFRAAKKAGVPIIAMVELNTQETWLSFCRRASTVMMGGFFAAAIEAPGRIVNLRPEQVPIVLRVF